MNYSHLESCSELIRVCWEMSNVFWTKLIFEELTYKEMESNLLLEYCSI